ncbi:hypothetical protein CY34DRAFT_813070 [Suillus luteus UH-Slu-Lm8-n1]|uniref:Uncharacterized protein n=1 Tax=Suillus luteus UH-Slu-Lm8-n1 TaxID=930992 RepID=A0A0C9ZXM6_9AGAM|nr:hypothetical protein CY34DRAFT_813070 [Suillus luteus UH-Slu-Lm8-n1]
MRHAARQVRIPGSGGLISEFLTQARFEPLGIMLQASISIGRTHDGTLLLERLTQINMANSLHSTISGPQADHGVHESLVSMHLEGRRTPNK